MVSHPPRRLFTAAVFLVLGLFSLVRGGHASAPEIDLLFSGVSIADGDTTPHPSDGTEFAETQAVGPGTAHIFTLANTGTGPLNVTSISRQGGTWEAFTVAPVGFTLPLSLAAGDSRTFKVTFNGAYTGERTTTLKILSDDSDEAEYEVDLLAFGITPVLRVIGPTGVRIDHGDDPLSDTYGNPNGTVFGEVGVGQFIDRTFLFRNLGGGNLEANVSFSGPGAALYSVVGSSSVSAESGETVPVTFRYSANTQGEHWAYVNIACNSLDVPVYQFMVLSYGKTGEIDVRGAGVSIADEDLTPDFADKTRLTRTAIGESATHEFAIHNTSIYPLTISGVSLDVGSEFTLNASSFPSVISPNSSASFTVTYSSATAGSHTDYVRILSDDVNEAIYNFAISGSAIVQGTLSPQNMAPNGHIYSTAVQPDGAYLVGGLHSTIGGYSTQAHISRIPAANTSVADGSFVPPVLASGDNVHCSAVLPDGKILIGGTFSFTASGKTWSRLVRLNADGSLDTTFVLPGSGTPPNPNNTVNAITVLKNGRILIAGLFTTVSGGSRSRIARLNADSTLDTTFTGPTIGAEVWSLAVTADEQVIIGGAFTALSGKSYVARLDKNGALQTGFTANANAVVNSVAIQADGNVILGGNFTTINGSSRTRLARVEGTTGVLDGTFTPAVTTTNGNVFSTVIQADGKIIAGGGFTAPANRIVRVEASGAVDTAFNPDVSSTGAIVYGLTLDKNGSLLAGGNFTTVGGNTRTNLALVNNGYTTDTLRATNSTTRVEWLRSGTAPEASQVIFERLSGSEWVPLVGATGAGSRIGTSSNWEITGVSLYQGFHTIRARARVQGGRGNGSSSLITSQTTFHNSFPAGPQPLLYVINSVQYPVSENVAEDFGTLYYAAGATVTPRTRTYTLRNIGNAALEDLAIQPLTGANPGDFTVSALSSSTLAPSQEITFTVSFRPGGTGARSAAFDIASNVTGTRNPFTFALSGAGSGTAFDVVYHTGADVGITTATFSGAGRTLTPVLNHVPQAGANLTVVEVTGLAFITQPFSNIAHGSTVTLTHNGVSYEYIADYFGGSGNDFELVWKHGRPVAWGPNQYTYGTSYGGSDSTTRAIPWPVSFTGPLAGKTILRLSTGRTHTLAVCTDGSVLAWGRNSQGQLGNNSTFDSTVPVVVNTAQGISALYDKKVVAVAAGDTHSLALCSDGTLVAWGNNGDGQLGNNNTPNDSSVPVLVNRTSGVSALFNKDVVSISAGDNFSLALTADGLMASWGENLHGQLGNGTTADKAVPFAVSRTSGALYPSRTVVAISAGGEHSLAIRSDGVVVGWGYNNNGELGDNSIAQRTLAVAVNADAGSALHVPPSGRKAVTAISAGVYHSLALCEDGSVVSWGSNDGGQLGNPALPFTYKSVPTAVNAGAGSALQGKTVVDVAAYSDFNLVLFSDGTLASWGRASQDGTLGTNELAEWGSVTPLNVSRLALSSAEYFGRLTQGGTADSSIQLTRGAPAPALVLPVSVTLSADGAVPEYQTFYNGLPLILQNSGSTPLVITELEFPSAPPGYSSYVLSPTPAPGHPWTLQPGSSVSISVQPGVSPVPLKIHNSLGIFEIQLD